MRVCFKGVPKDFNEPHVVPRSLEIGKEYYVIGIYAQMTESEGRRCMFNILARYNIDDFSEVFWCNSLFFEVVTDQVPSSWKVRATTTGNVFILPEKFHDNDFLQRFYEFDRTTIKDFNLECSTIIREDME